MTRVFAPLLIEKAATFFAGAPSSRPIEESGAFQKNFSFFLACGVETARAEEAKFFASFG
ncbi:MAG TPA: hypothetical protein VL356_07505 [Acidocella sp.]|nr:hypothetical protein [Acidocella sp.]